MNNTEDNGKRTTKKKRVRWTIELIRVECEKQGHRLITEVYKGANEPLEIICRCGNLSVTRISRIRDGRGCKICGREASAKKTRLSYGYVKEIYERNGCELISQEYKGTRSPLEFLCGCGKKWSSTFTQFQKSKSCDDCGRKRRIKVYPFKEVFEEFKKYECELLESEYRNSVTKMKFICSCKREGVITLSQFRKSRRCAKCGHENKSYQRVKGNKENPQKYTLKEVQGFFEDRGCKLLAKEYRNNKKPLLFLCGCGKKSYRELSRFFEFPFCKECGNKRKIDAKRNSYASVREEFEKRGLTLLSDTYVNQKEKLLYLCKCGRTASTSLDHLRIKLYDCPYCYEDNISKYTEDYIRKIVGDAGHEFVFSDAEHMNARVEFICKCGRKGDAKILSILKGANCRQCLHEFLREIHSGENNSNWNPNLTKEERSDRRLYTEYSKWRKEVYKRDNYTCQCCGEKSGDIVAHHKDSYNWCKERRIDVDNGETLCQHCHARGKYSFHRKYGFGDNTEEQYNEWLEKYKEDNINSKYF